MNKIIKLFFIYILMIFFLSANANTRNKRIDAELVIYNQWVWFASATILGTTKSWPIEAGVNIFYYNDLAKYCQLHFPCIMLLTGQTTTLFGGGEIMIDIKNQQVLNTVSSGNGFYVYQPNPPWGEVIFAFQQ